MLPPYGPTGAGTVTNVTGTAPVHVVDGNTAPTVSLDALGVTAAKLATAAVTTPKLATGSVTAIKLAAGIGFFGFILGRNGTGAVTFTGAKVGDTVFSIGILSAGPGQNRDAAAMFESTITVADQIQQSENTDQSAVGFMIILNRAGS